jgi:serine/threonine protein kinase
MGEVVAPAAAPRIGRFELLRELGRGAQGTVHLARDTRLERQVALKTLRLEHADGAGRQSQLAELLAEARIASQLAHANIVTLHDAGEERGVPYLVFEYVAGQTLAQRLHDEGPIAPPQAARIAIEILRGVAAAHAQQVLHRDLKPGNVMLARDGVARIMDFGIAQRGPQGAPAALSGTPAYMAPEYIAGGAFTPACDVFSVGMTLYEMLSGENPVKGGGVFEIMRRIAEGAIAPPSSRASACDERLDAIVMKALAKDPAERYTSANAMIDALQSWLNPAPEEDEEDDQPAASGTVEFLLRRMRHKSDFPALSATIAAVNKAVRGENERATVLANAILKDFGLTNKLIKLVNSAYFANLGGQVSTVSRAISILGFDRVRDIAISLVLFDHLKNRAQAAQLRDEIVAAYLAGVVARTLVAKLGVRDAEEAYVCAMFHRLGRMLVIFYLHEEAEAIARLAEANGDEARAAREVLGISYEELGMGIAQRWKLPGDIVASMRPVAAPVASRKSFEADKLRVLASLASGLCDAARASSEADRGVKLAALAERYGRALGINERALGEALAHSAVEVQHDAPNLGLPVVRGGVLDAARGIAAEGEPSPAPAADTLETIVAQTTVVGAPPAPPTQAESAPAAEQRRGLLTAGVQEVTQTLAGEFNLNDLLRMIVETMYRAIGCKRVLLCVRDPKANALRARFGLGADVEALLKAGFDVPLDGQRDVFYAALAQGADICIEDADAEKIRAYIPAWLRERAKPRGVLLLPIVIAKRPVALIYADADDAARLRFEPEALNLLKTLRNQAVLAIKQRG